MTKTLKLLADYRQAEEFSHFGSELAAEAKRSLEVGKRLFQMMTQSPTDTYSIMSQQLMLDIVLHAESTVPLDISVLKLSVAEYAAKVTDEKLYEVVRDELMAKCSPEAKLAAEASAEEAAATEKPSDASADKDKNDKSKDEKNKETKSGEKSEGKEAPVEVKA